MKNLFKIQYISLHVDVEKTKKYYLKENKIVDDCNCGDCRFYVDVILNKPIEIFQLLLKTGVNLEKNVASEPTGVWCIIDDGIFLYVEQTYNIVGQIVDENVNLNYKKIEFGYLVNAAFRNIDSDTISIYLSIELEK